MGSGMNEGIQGIKGSSRMRRIGGARGGALLQKVW
jgi:hypothetical protein